MSNNTEQKELKHNAEPGYQSAFLAAFTVMTFYLIFIFATTPWAAPGAHH